VLPQGDEQPKMSGKRARLALCQANRQGNRNGVAISVKVPRRRHVTNPADHGTPTSPSRRRPCETPVTSKTLQLAPNVWR